MIREIHSRLCLSLLKRRTKGLLPAQLNRSAVVFSPHYDDETLGAGGTIIQKRQAGAVVRLVFMTDGSRSHADAMAGSELSAMRRQEALKAASVLGVPDGNVTFLELPETRLSHHRVEAMNSVAELLSGLEFEEVYVPSRLEPLLWSADHRVTTDIVFEALTKLGRRPDVVEYLVWFWYHWPWVPIERGADVRRLLRLTWANRFGMSAWTGLNTAVPIADVVAQKRLALEQYASQMTRIMTDRRWPVLSDVAHGEFLTCFFQPTEFFRVYQYSGAMNGK